MEPEIQNTQFGSVTVGGEVYDHDIVIRLGGKVEKRKKELSRQRYGNSHTVSPEEAEDLFDEGAERFIVGTGQYGALKLSQEAEDYLRNKSCLVTLLPTPEAVRAWNEAREKVVALFHVTC